MAEPKKNSQLMAQLMMGFEFAPMVRYGPKRIAGNLLTMNSPLLKEAKGEIVPHPRLMMFGFGVEGDVKGELLIAAPPLAYTAEDRTLLAGIIRHELRHAADFVHMGGRTEGMGTGQIAYVDTDAYFNHILEARAYSDQLKWLLNLMGGNERLVVDTLKKNAFFGLSADITKAVEYFLEAFSKQKHEAVFPSFNNPPAMVSKAKGVDSQQVHAEKAAHLVVKIMEIMSFSNMVHVPRGMK